MSARALDTSRWSAAALAVSRVYGQILFSRSPLVGLLLFLATATVPRAMVFGLLAIGAAAAAALCFGLETEAILDGAYGYNALLVALGIAQTFTGWSTAVPLALVAAVASVLVTAALRASLGGAMNLPVLSLPFVAVFHLVLGASSFTGLAAGAPALDTSAAADLLPGSLVLFARSLGAIFFLPRVDAGLLVLAALLLHSRIAALLAGAAFAVVSLLGAEALSLPGPATLEMLGFNAILTAVALGAVWFVPSSASTALALAGALVAVLLGIGALSPLARLGLPALILPFNLAVLLVLVAMRRRARDGAPKAVDFLSGTPEENLSYYRMRRARFRRLYPVSFQLPFRGRWVCTQGRDGAITHQGIWRHAFDFEVKGEGGHVFRDGGMKLEHYHAFRLPVVAAADGTVVKVEAGIADNPIGELNLEQNWGNHVLVYHAPGLYSLVAHLAKGTIKVVEGQRVQQGDVLGLCGNSGRSPEPHLHFHLQSTPVLGGPTLPCQFNDVVVVPEIGASQVKLAAEPSEGQVVRNLDPDDDVAAHFAFRYGETWSYQSGKSVEHVTCDVDVLGNYLLRSADRKACLFYGKSDRFFTTYSVLGGSGSVLHAFRAALSRVPFSSGESLRWTDYLPARELRAWPLRVLSDFLSPFLPHDEIEVEFGMRREGLLLIVEGASRRRDRRGAPVLTTRAELARGVGPLRIALTVRGKTITAERVARGLAELGSITNTKEAA